MKKYTIERDGQIDFFNQFQIDYINNEVLIDNTDGVYNGNLLEFKLNITDINKVLFQTIKYLSNMRVKGESVPANILCIDLNSEICYVYHSQDYFDEIHEIYYGGASKNIDGFISKSYVDKIDYSQMSGAQKIKEYLKETKYMKIKLDENCIVGWAERYYREYPKADKGDFLDDREGLIVNKTSEIRDPKVFQDYIIPYTGKTNEKFKYLMDKLNDKLHKKELGAFYTPIPYCVKAVELVREAIQNIPEGNDYIILDRCAGTGNLESVLTDEELSHCILSTIEYYEYKVLLERLGEKVRAIIPPIESQVKYQNGFIMNADAMSEEYLNNEIIKKYLDDKDCTVILFENPPYNDTSSITSVYDDEGNKYVTNNKESFVFNEMSKEKDKFRNKNISTIRDYANRFIWSGFKYYLRQKGDAYIVFSPVKYFKSLGIIENDDYKFKRGYLFNRKYFHATASSISCVLWSYEENDIKNDMILQTFDIEDDVSLKYIKDTKIKKVFKPFNNYQDKVKGKNQIYICCDSSGGEAFGRKPETMSYDDDYIIGYFCLVSASFDLGRLAYFNGRGFYLTKTNFLKKLPLFCAKKYPQENWYEKDVYFTCSDNGEEYAKDNELIKQSLIYTCLSNQNHMISFKGSNDKLYTNELCFDENTEALTALNNFKLNEEEQELISLYKTILKCARETKNYNYHFKYGTYQIDTQLNTYVVDKETKKKIYNYPVLNGHINTLKSKLKKYYKNNIEQKLFEYELLK